LGLRPFVPARGWASSCFLEAMMHEGFFHE
jgi:hypothetical protein